MTRPVTTTSRAVAQALGDAEGAEVGVGGERLAQAELGGALAQVVALDVGDVDVEAELVGERAHGGGEPGRVEPAGVGDDRDAPLEGGAEGRLELAQERLGVAERAVLAAGRGRG